MSEELAALLGLGAWSAFFIPLFLLWRLPEHYRTQAMRQAAQRREERLRQVSR